MASEEFEDNYQMSAYLGLRRRHLQVLCLVPCLVRCLAQYLGDISQAAHSETERYFLPGPVPGPFPGPVPPPPGPEPPPPTV